MENTLSLLNKQLHLSDDKQHLLLLISPLKDKISADYLTACICQSKYNDLKIIPTGIKEAVTFFNKLEEKADSEAEVKSVIVAERLDAQLSITLDEQKLTAKAKIISAFGGNAITLEQITHEITALEITYGIASKTVLFLIKKSKEAKPGTPYQAIIAQGKPAIDGFNATFERLVQTANERLTRPQEQEDGHVDMRDLGQLITVKKGAALMRKIPHDEGTPGLTVTNEVIKQQEGKDIAFTIGDNTELDANDNNMLIASIAGVPQVLDNGMKVDDALMVKNVDVGFGHIDYEGSVIVAGDICDGMKVKATGDITVAGFIESANVDCNGDLFVGKGILGHKRGADSNTFSCEINCKGSVTAGFSQYTKMHIEKDLHIKNQLLHCQVLCKGHISVQNDFGSKGVILGGLLCAYKGLSTITLGSPAGTKTLIDLIGDYPHLMEVKKQLNDTIQQEQDKLFSVLQAQKKLAGCPKTEKTQALTVRLMLTREEAEKQLLQLNAQQDENLINLKEYFNISRLISLKELHSQVSISIGRDIFRAARSYGPTRVSVQENKLIAEPYLP